MRLPNLRTTPMRLFIKIRTFKKKIRTKSLLDVLKVLHLAKFSEISSRHTTQDTFSVYSKLLFSIQISCARHFLFAIKDNPPLPCENINFLIFFVYSTS